VKDIKNMPQLCHKILEENVGKVMEFAACNVCVFELPILNGTAIRGTTWELVLRS
jgi:hypothetical protein